MHLVEAGKSTTQGLSMFPPSQPPGRPMEQPREECQLHSQALLAVSASGSGAEKDVDNLGFQASYMQTMYRRTGLSRWHR